MQTSPAMQRLVLAILAHHGMKPGAELCLKLTQPGYMPLVIEMPLADMVSVAHYYRQNGDLIADPDVVFVVRADGWVPVEIQQPLGYGNYINAPAGQADLAVFAEFWAKNLEDQGWLTDGVVERSQDGIAEVEA